jgi:hypothetical protein
MRRLVGICLVSILFPLACDEGVATPRSTAPTRRPSPTPTETEVCPNRDDARVEPGSLRGDVDGDGGEDVVRIAVDEGGAPGCLAFVAVETSRGELVAPIRDENMDFSLGFPALNTLAEIDGRPGSEVVVDVTAGASTAFAGVFTSLAGRLERMRIKGDPLGYGELFPYGGSVGHLESSDCARDGGIVVSVATAFASRYELKRNFFSIAGPSLTLEDTQRVRIELRELQDFPEFAGLPFASCD